MIRQLGIYSKVKQSTNFLVCNCAKLGFGNGQKCNFTLDQIYLIKGILSKVQIILLRSASTDKTVQFLYVTSYPYVRMHGFIAQLQ